jgi:hypothetical protein
LHAAYAVSCHFFAAFPVTRWQSMGVAAKLKTNDDKGMQL